MQSLRFKRARKFAYRQLCKFAWENTKPDESDHKFHHCINYTCMTRHRCSCGSSFNKQRASNVTNSLQK
jgi:hypothetical protein